MCIFENNSRKEEPHNIEFFYQKKGRIKARNHEKLSFRYSKSIVLMKNKQTVVTCTRPVHDQSNQNFSMVVGVPSLSEVILTSCFGMENCFS